MHITHPISTEIFMTPTAQHTHTTLELARNSASRLSHATATRLKVVDGVAWITVDGDQRDIVLERGASFDVETDADVIVFALGGPAAVEVHAPARVS
jgi:hypothetical protein